LITATLIERGGHMIDEWDMVMEEKIGGHMTAMTTTVGPNKITVEVMTINHEQC
jgi:hypothetical protein